MCKEDFGDKKKPIQWEEAIKILQSEFTNNLVIQAFLDVMYQEVVVLTVHRLRGFVIIVILPLQQPPLLLLPLTMMVMMMIITTDL